MKILHIAECAGGVERYLQMLLPRLEKRGLWQFFICSKNYNKQSYENMVDGVDQMDLKQTFSPLQVWRKVSAIRQVIKQIKPDIIYCHSSFAGGLGRMAAIGLHCKVVYNPHGWGFMCMDSPKKTKVFCMMERILALLTDKIVCISEAEKKAALNLHIVRESHVEVIPNGVDVNAVVDSSSVNRDTLGIEEDAFVVGMAARITKLKSPDVFVRAAEIIWQNIPKAKFLIVGDGEERKEIETFAQERGIPVHITGWTNDVYHYIKVMNVGMLLSRWWEGFGLAVVEYMSAGVNVIASKTGGIPELINDNNDGLLVEVDSPQDVADKVLWLYHHPEEAAEMRRKALQKVIENYDISRVVDQHVDMFKKLCDGK